MGFHRNRKLSPFSHLRKGPLLDRLFSITRPTEPEAKPAPEEPPAPPAKPLIYGRGLVEDEPAEQVELPDTDATEPSG